MHRTIRCCVDSCPSSAMVADGLIESSRGQRGTEALRNLASRLGWTECEHSTRTELCFRCPDHTVHPSA